MNPGSSRNGRGRSGVALIEASAFVFIVLLLLSGTLLVVQSRRERIHKEFYNTVAEAEGRALRLDLREFMATKIRQTGGFDPTTWDPSVRVTSTLLAGGALAPRTTSLTGGDVSAFPLQPKTFPHPPSDPLYQSLSRKVSLSMSADWAPPDTGNMRTMTKWRLQMPIWAEEVPLSVFNYYASSAEENLLSGGALGRVYFEKDVRIQSPVEINYAALVGGSLRVVPGGALLIRTFDPSQPAVKAFGPGASLVDFQTQGVGLLFVRDAAPVPLCRPVSTGELFDTQPLGSPAKNSQRFKVQSDLQVSVDASGVPTPTWAVPPATPVNLQPVFSLDNSVPGQGCIVIDLSLWPVGASWAPSLSLWVESSAPGIRSVRIRNAAHLLGAFSLATPYQIQVSGHFNTVGVQNASLLTPQQVIALP